MELKSTGGMVDGWKNLQLRAQNNLGFECSVSHLPNPEARRAYEAAIRPRSCNGIFSAQLPRRMHWAAAAHMSPYAQVPVFM